MVVGSLQRSSVQTLLPEKPDHCAHDFSPLPPTPLTPTEHGGTM